MTAIEKLNAELNRLFDLFNEHYYSELIKKPIILAQTNGRNGNTMGWCTRNKIWKDHDKNEFYYEITICSEYLYMNVEETCATLLHEMVHLFCNENGIKNTSRGGTYHNKRYKEVAEKHGLIIEYDKRIGWSLTKLSEDAIAFIEANVNKDVFVLTRTFHKAIGEPETPSESDNGGEEEQGGEEPPKPKQSLRKYVCPKCGTIIRASKNVNVKCADCDELFIKE